MTLKEFTRLTDEEQDLWIKKNYERKDLEFIWNRIYWIKKQKFGNEDKDKKKEEKKRTIKLLFNYCKDFYALPKDKTIELINFYSTIINKKEYIFDVVVTTDKNYYVKVTDITNGYEEIDFNEFKSKHCQPTLFDDFFNI